MSPILSGRAHNRHLLYVLRLSCCRIYLLGEDTFRPFCPLYPYIRKDIHPCASKVGIVRRLDTADVNDRNASHFFLYQCPSPIFLLGRPSYSRETAESPQTANHLSRRKCSSPCCWLSPEHL